MTTPQDPQAQPPYGQPPYGQPPAPPYGQPPAPPYGQPPAAPYGYGSGYGGPYGTGPAPAYDYAHWGLRVTATLVDALLSALFFIPAIIGYAVASSADPGETAGSAIVLLAVGYLLLIAFSIWNLWRQGTKGATLGKQAVGIQLVKEQTGQFVGGWMSIGRAFAHAVDNIACYIGYLWPLWDAKRQTFADKLVGTVVVRRPA